MKKSIALPAMALCLIMLSCSNQSGADPYAVGTGFDVAPALELVPVNGGFAYTWQDSTPAADSVDLHWRVSESPVEDVNFIWEFGYVRKNVILFDTIAVSLDEGEYFSAFITVHKAGYASAYSNVVVKESSETSTDKEFDDAPVLTVTSGVGSLVCTWTSAYPFPTNYDLYYVEGNFTSAARVKANGIRIRDCIKPDNNGSVDALKYTIEPLDHTKTYSVLVSAKRMGYASIDSVVRANQQPIHIVP